MLLDAIPDIREGRASAPVQGSAEPLMPPSGCSFHPRAARIANDPIAKWSGRHSCVSAAH
jgi:ABC-type dipeptide/oligopeptide/nickel transport system ATPase component